MTSKNIVYEIVVRHFKFNDGKELDNFYTAFPAKGYAVEGFHAIGSTAQEAIVNLYHGALAQESACSMFPDNCLGHR